MDPGVAPALEIGSRADLTTSRSSVRRGSAPAAGGVSAPRVQGAPAGGGPTSRRAFRIAEAFPPSEIERQLQPGTPRRDVLQFLDRFDSLTRSERERVLVALVVGNDDDISVASSLERVRGQLDPPRNSWGRTIHNRYLRAAQDVLRSPRWADGVAEGASSGARLEEREALASAYLDTLRALVEAGGPTSDSLWIQARTDYDRVCSSYAALRTGETLRPQREALARACTRFLESGLENPSALEEGNWAALKATGAWGDDTTARAAMAIARNVATFAAAWKDLRGPSFIRRNLVAACVSNVSDCGTVATKEEMCGVVLGLLSASETDLKVRERYWSWLEVLLVPGVGAAVVERAPYLVGPGDDQRDVHRLVSKARASMQAPEGGRR